MPPKRNLVGKSFGLLKVEDEVTGRDRVLWRCRCVCGRTTVTQTSNLNSGHTRGCNHCTRNKHGEHTHPLYKIWAVRVCSPHGCCSQWKTYAPFREWAIANGWKRGLWIHRKADQGIYRPENCFIAPRRFQAQFGQSANAKLLPSDIHTIRQLSVEGWSTVEIGQKYNAHPRTIRDVLNGITWRST